MSYSFEPIGYLRGGGEYACQAPRQGVLDDIGGGCIELLPHCNYETAAADLAGFARIWVVFVFDRVKNWQVKVTPPVGDGRRHGVFATRSPHRPNPIGISAVELLRVEGRWLHIAGFDLLDGTPILDIKPYIPEADAFPDAATGWRGTVQGVSRQLEFVPGVLELMRAMRQAGAVDLERACRTQLATRELDPARQRLRLLSAEADRWELACRTWRIVFVREVGRELIRVEAVRSGYSLEELRPGAPDPYGDKEWHRRFFTNAP